MGVQRSANRAWGKASRNANWAGNVSWQPVQVARPATVSELRDVLAHARSAGATVRPAGSRHSFTPLCATDGIGLDLGSLRGIRRVEGDLVTVGAGTALHELNQLLDGIGRALANLGDIDRQTIAGAISTGTHGTGSRFAGLAAQVESFTLVTAAGEELLCSSDSEPDLFHAALVGLGAFGVVTEIALRTVPAFGLHQVVAPETLAAIMSTLPERMEADHFEFFWFPLGDAAQLKSARRMAAGEPTSPLSPLRHYVEDVLVENAALGAMCRFGRRWPGSLPRLHSLIGSVISERESSDASFRMFATTRNVRFLESEYAIPRHALPAVLEAVGALAQGLPVGPAFPVEVRFAAADDIWLSTGFERENAYVAVHQYVGMAHERYFAEFAEICAGVGGRPHWGKMHPLGAAQLAGLYPRFADAAVLRRQVDPDGLFLNEHLRAVFGES
ncbi:MAG: D-arabinono-1,4-lactone oxidase [Candidatus Nanopelagicales bacterium]